MTAKKRAAGGWHTITATLQRNTSTVPITDDDSTPFATLASRFALAGHSLMRGNPSEGATTYYAMRWGYVKVLPTLDAAHAFLLQIGGLR